MARESIVGQYLEIGEQSECFATAKIHNFIRTEKKIFRGAKSIYSATNFTLTLPEAYAIGAAYKRSARMINQAIPAFIDLVQNPLNLVEILPDKTGMAESHLNFKYGETLKGFSAGTGLLAALTTGSRVYVDKELTGEVQYSASTHLKGLNLPHKPEPLKVTEKQDDFSEYVLGTPKNREEYVKHLYTLNPGIYEAGLSLQEYELENGRRFNLLIPTEIEYLNGAIKTLFTENDSEIAEHLLKQDGPLKMCKRILDEHGWIFSHAYAPIHILPDIVEIPKDGVPYARPDKKDIHFEFKDPEQNPIYLSASPVWGGIGFPRWDHGIGVGVIADQISFREI
jgi:hypothetical protein